MMTLFLWFFVYPLAFYAVARILVEPFLQIGMWLERIDAERDRVRRARNRLRRQMLTDSQRDNCAFSAAYDQKTGRIAW